uniref:WKF domain-containing protein n=1 Tax=Spongospora subterranea TaxID=70186 RepID=A0A0H5RCQ3_9EUKA|eukprot:CRZ11778.1 hypothetical protein [Spongospora subterranea]
MVSSVSASFKAKVSSHVQNQAAKVHNSRKKSQVKEISAAKPEVDTKTSSEPHPALQYLTLWDSDKSQWKFAKARQIWLLKNMMNRDKIPKASFKMLLRYINSMTGHARTASIEKVKAILAQTPNGEEDKTLRKFQRRAKCILAVLDADHE